MADDVILTRTVVKRGSFTIPAALFEDGRDYDLGVFYAQRMPEGAKGARRDVLPNGDVVQHWRIVTREYI